jgi:inner membrane protein
MVVARTQRASLRPALLAGLGAGLLPDADIFLKSAEDPMFSLEYHRHFTHSLAFSPFIALLGAGIAWLLYRLFGSRLNFRQLLFPAWIAGLSHTLCDVWTSYGTRVWWPFSNERVSWDWISVVDIILTLPLLICVLVALFKSSRKLAWFGLSWVMLYLCFCNVQRFRAYSALQAWAQENGFDAIERDGVKPSFGNVIVWRGMLVQAGKFQVVAIRCPLLAPPIVTKGQQQALFASARDAADALKIPHDSTQGSDIVRFHHFSDGWIGLHPHAPNTLSDLRYATMPAEVEPLWGIEVNPANPQKHADWKTFRTIDRTTWNRYWNVVTGKK